MKQFPLLPGQREHRHESEDDDRHGEEDRPADLLGGEAMTSRTRPPPAMRHVFSACFAMPDDVFRHHDAGIHQHADGDGDAGQRHDVRRDAELLHQDERDQDRDRQRQRDDEDAAEVPEENDVRERDEDDFLDERVLERVDRAVDQFAAIVERLDGDARRQARARSARSSPSRAR